jgi:ABC-type bacteriocin/lantibiotic exporter with double-glycine peptidase domain
MKADNNPWQCDCEMKDFFEYISKQGSAFSGFTCKEPLKYENLSWKCLADVDCTARNIEGIAEKPTSVFPRRSLYSTSAVTDVTEETATNIHVPTPTTLVDTSLLYWCIVLIVLLSLVIILVLIYFIVVRICKHRSPREQTRENTGALLSGNDEPQTQSEL